MIRLKMKNDNRILTEKQQKYCHYHHIKLIIMNILHANQSRIIAQAKFAYFPLGKALKRSNKETVLKSLKLLKQMN